MSAPDTRTFTLAELLALEARIGHSDWTSMYREYTSGESARIHFACDGSWWRIETDLTGETIEFDEDLWAAREGRPPSFRQAYEAVRVTEVRMVTTRFCTADERADLERRGQVLS